MNRTSDAIVTTFMNGIDSSVDLVFTFDMKYLYSTSLNQIVKIDKYITIQLLSNVSYHSLVDNHHQSLYGN